MPDSAISTPVGLTPMNSPACRAPIAKRIAAVSPSHSTSWNSSGGEPNASKGAS